MQKCDHFISPFLIASVFIVPLRIALNPIFLSNIKVSTEIPMNPFSREYLDILLDIIFCFSTPLRPPLSSSIHPARPRDDTPAVTHQKYFHRTRNERTLTTIMSRRKPKWTQEPLSSQLRYEYEYQLRKLYLQHDKVSAALRYAPESLSLLSKRQSLQRQIYDVELQARSDMVSLASGLDPSSITPSKSLTSKDGVETYARLVAKQAAKSTASTSKEDAKPVPKVWSWKGRKVQIVPKGSDKSERERIHRGGFGGRGPIYRDLDSRLLDYSTLVLEKDSSEKRGDVPVSESVSVLAPL